MALRMQEASLRSTKIDYRRLELHVMARVSMADGSFFNVFRDGHDLLRIQLMPATFRAEIIEKLIAGQGAHVPLTAEQVERMVFRLPRVNVGDKIWMQSFLDDTFFRVFHLSVEVVDVTVLPPAGRIPRQR